MKNYTPLGRLRIFPIIIIEIFAFVAIPFTTDGYFAERKHREWDERYTANGNAKMLYINIDTYLTKMEINNGKGSTEHLSGVFTGSLKTTGTPETSLNASLDGSAEDINYALKYYMGRRDKKAGYYYVYIKNGVPLQTYWSEHKKSYQICR